MDVAGIRAAARIKTMATKTGWHQDIKGGKSRTLKGSVGMSAKGDKLSKTKGGMAKSTSQPSNKCKK